MEKPQQGSILESSNLAKVCQEASNQDVTTTEKVQKNTSASQKVSSQEVGHPTSDGQSAEPDYQFMQAARLVVVPRKVPSVISATNAMTSPVVNRFQQQVSSSASDPKLVSSSQHDYHQARQMQNKSSLDDVSSSHLTNHLQQDDSLFNPRKQQQSRKISTVMLDEDPSNDGIQMVQRLHNRRLERSRDRLSRINQNKGLGSTKAAYSTSYSNFHAQLSTNVSHVYSVGDRSERKRKLCASELNVKLPPLPIQTRRSMQKPLSILALQPLEGEDDSRQHLDMHINDQQHPQDSILSTNRNHKLEDKRVVSDSINGSTQVDRANHHMGSVGTKEISDREMTPGWQFATQIETEDDDVTRNNDHSDLVISTVDYREMQPSMLDPAFDEDDHPSNPRTPQLQSRSNHHRNQVSTVKHFMSSSQDRPLWGQQQHKTMRDQRFASDYQIDTFVRPTGLLNSVQSPAPKALGVKAFAWKGIQDCRRSTDGRLIHHQDKLFIERCKKRDEKTVSDNLPCGINEVPGHIYVTSDMSKRSTQQVQHQHLYESLYRSEFNHFSASKEGSNYFLGVLPSVATQKRSQMISTSQKQQSSKKRSSIISMGRKSSQESTSESQQMRVLDDLPTDVMHIVIKNHKKRDEATKQRKENTRRIIKEKQIQTQAEVEKKRFYRKQGIPMPEDAEMEQQIKIQTEVHLLQQQRRRRQKEKKTQQWRHEMLSYLTDMERKEMSDEQQERLEDAISRFNQMVYPKNCNDEVKMMKMVKTPRTSHRGY